MEKEMQKKYCSGMDCAWCDEKEPCIYKETDRLRAQYEAVVKQNRELQQENKRLLNLVSTAQKCSEEASYLYYAAITDPQKRANTVYKIYEDLKNAIKEVQNV